MASGVFMCSSNNQPLHRELLLLFQIVAFKQFGYINL